MGKADQTETAVAVVTQYDTDDLRALSSFEDALRLAEQAHGPTVAADEELGDGFALLDAEAKDRLIGVPCLFMEWSFHPGDYGEFVSVRVAAKIGDALARYIVNDGSTGIYAQLRDFTDRHNRTGGLVARRGLRKSEYSNEYTEHAVTHYIDTSA